MDIKRSFQSSGRKTRIVRGEEGRVESQDRRGGNRRTMSGIKDEYWQ